MTLVAGAYANVVDILTDAGLNVTTDPRNVAPPCVVLEPPSIVDSVGDVVTLRFQIVCCSAPPANADTTGALLDVVDTVLSAVPFDGGGPGSVRYGSQELYAYSVYSTLSFRKD